MQSSRRKIEHLPALVAIGVFLTPLLAFLVFVTWYFGASWWKSVQLRQHAQEYLSAVESGDLERVLELSDELGGGDLRWVTGEAGQAALSSAFLTEEVLMNAEARISDVVIERVYVSNDIRGERSTPGNPSDGRVDISFVLDSEVHRKSLNYVYIDGRWQLRQGLIEVLRLWCVPGPGVSVKIAGVEVDPSLVDSVPVDRTYPPWDEDDCDVRYIALISGVYRVQAVADSSVEIHRSSTLEEYVTIGDIFTDSFTVDYVLFREPSRMER